MRRRPILFAFLGTGLLLATTALAQEIAPPAPQPLHIHSNVLNEDRIVWVRTPSGYEHSKDRYPAVYQTDAPGQLNEIGSSADFLSGNERMPAVIVVGIGNTDRTRDLTPTHADWKNPDGTITNYPTSGGADKFLEFLRSELIPEIEKRYRTVPYRIFSGHSLGGLFAIHALITRPDLFNAYIAVSPSLQWDSGVTVRRAEQFFATHPELKRKLFFSLASEGNTANPMADNFTAFQKLVAEKAPKGLKWESARYPDEDHGSTVLRAHYAGLRLVFSDWPVPRDEKTGQPAGGLAGIEQHYKELSESYGYSIPVPETTLNNLGYQFINAKNYKDAIAVLRRNVELYAWSANVYDSLGEAQEAAGKFPEATKNYEKAIELAKETNDARLSQFSGHMERVTAAATKAAKPNSAAAAK